MKLLSWMQSKFCQKSSDAIKDFAMGQPSRNEKCYRSKTTCASRLCRQIQPANHLKPFTAMEVQYVEEESRKVETSVAMSELFHGFLAIGTLGSDPCMTFPSTQTPTTEKEAVSETRFKCLSDKLENTTAAKVIQESFDTLSGRNTHGSTIQSTEEITITLSGNSLGSKVLPLEDDNFFTITTAKKEQKMSLRELFQNNKPTKEQRDKDANEFDVKILKNMQKKKVPHVPVEPSEPFGGLTNSAPAETKRKKILHIFHRKVHPGSPTSSKYQQELPKNQSSSYHGVHKNHKKELLDGEINTIEGGDINSCKSLTSPETTLKDNSTGSKEVWIKTDADYLVLEL